MWDHMCTKRVTSNHTCVLTQEVHNTHPFTHHTRIINANPHKNRLTLYRASGHCVDVPEISIDFDSISSKSQIIFSISIFFHVHIGANPRQCVHEKKIEIEKFI